MSQPRLTHLLPLLAASLLLAACASTGPATKTAAADSSSQATLKERALQRWNDLIAHDGAKAYEYLTPGYRAAITREQYAQNMNNRPMAWKKVTMNQVTCDNAAKCTVYLFVDYTVPMPGMGMVDSSAPLTEQWLLLDNQWYYLPGK